MPTCPRCAFVALAFLVLAVAGCDSNNPGNLENYEGTYTIDQLAFNAQGVTPANVALRLDDSSEIDIRSNRASVDFEYDDSTDECRAIDGNGALAVLDVSAGRETLNFSARGGDDEDALECLLLPKDFTLRVATSDPSGKTLTATLENTRVNLYDYDRDSYNETQTNVPGTLTISISRP